ncbi:MAG: hypothetical protein FJ275_14515, partial [Planctomycetes bacterium]|nr:hypothetical protein [Planctomycetota bacterium]
MPPGSARRPGRAALRGRGKRAGRLGRWLAIGIAILLGATAVGRCLEPEAAVPPRWLAVPLDAAAAAVVFRRDFDSPEGIQEAELRLAADYARATVRINGRTLIRVEPYCPLQTRAATGLLRRGRNRLEVALEPVAGPAAFAVSLAWQPLAGPRKTLVSDARWVVAAGGAEQPAVDGGPVPAELWGIGRRDIALAAVENYE